MATIVSFCTKISLLFGARLLDKGHGVTPPLHALLGLHCVLGISGLLDSIWGRGTSIREENSVLKFRNNGGTYPHGMGILVQAVCSHHVLSRVKLPKNQTKNMPQNVYVPVCLLLCQTDKYLGLAKKKRKLCWTQTVEQCFFSSEQEQSIRF